MRSSISFCMRSLSFSYFWFKRSTCILRCSICSSYEVILNWDSWFRLMNLARRVSKSFESWFFRAISFSRFSLKCLLWFRDSCKSDSRPEITALSIKACASKAALLMVNCVNYSSYSLHSLVNAKICRSYYSVFKSNFSIFICMLFITSVWDSVAFFRHVTS